jgi:hypothetical protein
MPVQRQQKITSLFQQNASDITKPKTKKPNPPSVKTDIVISIKKEHMENIVSRVKNHEFRKYNISSNIERMWYVDIVERLVAVHFGCYRFYVSAPEQTLRYIAVIRYVYPLFSRLYTC